MAVEHRDLFCDESDTHRRTYFLIGGIECSPRRSEIITNKIKLLKLEKNCDHELKWTGIGNNERYIEIYKSLIDVFLNDRYMNFKVMKFNKNRDWKKWSKSEDERFYKCYYYFLQSFMNPFKRYQIYLDEKEVSKKYNWDSLYWSLVNSFKAKEPEFSYNNKRNIQILKTVKSRKEEMIQLVDVLTKASLNNNSKNKGKQEVANYFIKNFDPEVEEWNFDIARTKQYKKRNQVFLHKPMYLITSCLILNLFIDGINQINAFSLMLLLEWDICLRFKDKTVH